MTPQRKRQRGVPHLETKLAICRKLLGAYTPTELAEVVLNLPGQTILAGKVADTFRKWKDHTPTKSDGAAQFWDALPAKLGCDETVTGAMLVDASVDEFIGYLPEDQQKRARQILAGLALPEGEPQSFAEPAATPTANLTSDFQGASNVFWIYLLHTGPVETIPTGLHVGKIDQRHYYLDPDSASGWSRLVRAEAYPTYDHCKAALQALMESKSWKQSLDLCRPGSVVMLAGGGAPTKDLLMLRSLLGQPYVEDHLHYYLTDISMYMLRESALWIREYSQSIDKSDKFSLGLVHGDVLDMKGMTDLKRIVHRHGRVVFGITGGTIGNFSESSFFRSLDHAAADGDLLIVSADTIDGVPTDAVEKTLTDKYDNPDLRRFIKPVVRAVVSESSTQEPINKALDRIKVTLRPGGDAHASDVPMSRSVIVTLDLAGRDITLVTSTRYKSSELIAFAAKYGWHAVSQIPSPLNPHYKQFFFRRNKVESTGNR